MNFLIWRTFNFRFLRYRCLLLKNNILHHRAPRTTATWTLHHLSWRAVTSYRCNLQNNFLHHRAPQTAAPWTLHHQPCRHRKILVPVLSTPFAYYPQVIFRVVISTPHGVVISNPWG